MIDKQKLRQQLEQLHDELHQVTSVSGDVRGSLEKLAADVRELLDRGEIEPTHYEGLGDRLRNELAQLEASYPTVTMRLRDLLTELSYLGI
jgi:chromosome segregation ATPase